MGVRKCILETIVTIDFGNAHCFLTRTRTHTHTHQGYYIFLVGEMVVRSRLRIVYMFVLLSTSSLLLLKLKLNFKFNFIPNENSILDFEPARYDHNRLSNMDELDVHDKRLSNMDELDVHDKRLSNMDELDVHDKKLSNMDELDVHDKRLSNMDELDVHDKRLKFGLSHSVADRQSKYDQVHRSRKKDGDEVEQGNNADYSKRGDWNNHKFEHMKSPNPGSHSAGSLSLYPSSQLPPAHHMPPPALISQALRSNSAQSDLSVSNNAGQNDNEQRSLKFQEHPSLPSKEIQSHVSADQHLAQTRHKFQGLQISRANYMHNKYRHPSRTRNGAHSVLPNIPNLKRFKIKSKSILERGFHMDYGFDSPELLQRRKYITAALEGATVLQRNMAKVSLNTNLLERGKVK